MNHRYDRACGLLLQISITDRLLTTRSPSTNALSVVIRKNENPAALTISSLMKKRSTISTSLGGLVESSTTSSKKTSSRTKSKMTATSHNRASTSSHKGYRLLDSMREQRKTTGRLSATVPTMTGLLRCKRLKRRSKLAKAVSCS